MPAHRDGRAAGLNSGGKTARNVLAEHSNDTAPLRPDSETIRAFWGALVDEGGVHEVRIPAPKQPANGKPMFWSCPVLVGLPRFW
jgi:hypothetical protein